MSRYIDADALIDRNKVLADCEFIHPLYQATLKEIVEESPTIDTVKVIRCRDCKYYRTSRSINDVTITECLYAMPVWVEPNGYCYHAKRKNNDQNT